MGGAECILLAILIEISQVAMFLQCRKNDKLQRLEFVVP
ncbi:hypothetical protein SEVIR_2G282750v4 [Setaria viridis]|uniref:Uncharacterized protein n=1 Tax=Setaria viridis TaxID=4556 RepID=A0A4U6VVV5_SETVI|nr:hypothetical protein SEVIR_2G282750v2 [Setaria viridis]